MKKKKKTKLRPWVIFLIVFMITSTAICLAFRKPEEKTESSGNIQTPSEDKGINVHEDEFDHNDNPAHKNEPVATEGAAEQTKVLEDYIPDEIPDVSKIDTTKIAGEYDPNPDTEGLEVIDQSILGDTAKIKYLKALTDKGAVIEIINGTSYVNGILMVNKTYRLPSYYVPKDTHEAINGRPYVYGGLVNEAWDAWQEMQAAAKKERLNISISSGYRSYDTQETLFSNYVMMQGLEAADTFSARAGHSEHQSGLCFDLNSVNDTFTGTAEGRWVNDNCYKYGFCVRFPEGKDDMTGYKYESWHLRYVGVQLATELYNEGDWLSIEEYFGLTSTYNYEYVAADGDEIDMTDSEDIEGT